MTETLALPNSDATLAALRRLQAAGAHAKALDQATALLDRQGDDRELLLIAARSARHCGRIDTAMALLDRLTVLHPRLSLLHQERGLCHIARKEAQPAIAALLEAVNINPALPFAWRMLEGVYRLVGDADNAALAAQHCATLAVLPPDVVQATASFSDGDLTGAETTIRAFLLRYGDHPEAMRLLAKIGLAREVYDDAETLLAGVLAMVPDHRAARFEYARALSFRHKHVEAEAALGPLLAEEPGNRDYRALASTIAVGLGQHDRAIAIYRALLDDLPEPAPGEPATTLAGLALARADLNLWLGHALKTIGRIDPAIAAYRTAAAVRPDFGDAWWSLANLKTYQFTPAEIATMQAAEADPRTAPPDRIHLAFALGKAFEDRGDFAASWRCYEAGNALQRARSTYHPRVFETNTREQRRVCTARFFAERAGWGCGEPDPIFVLGLPRSGSTLLEQILASHPEIEGTQELPNIQRYVQEMQGRDPDIDHPRYPGTLEHLTANEARALGERFLAETRPHRVLGRRLFVDKMPNNFRHIGLIHLILPQARIIDARREPMACCFSNLKQLFAQGQEFSYAAEDIARYYRTYLELMRHWDAVLPGRVLRVINEDVIEDLEGQVRRMLAYCHVRFDPACLAFNETRRSVRTPSSEQVRRPINRDGMDQWRAFAPWLEPLRAALGDAVTRWRD